MDTAALPDPPPRVSLAGAPGVPLCRATPPRSRRAEAARKCNIPGHARSRTQPCSTQRGRAGSPALPPDPRLPPASPALTPLAGVPPTTPGAGRRLRAPAASAPRRAGVAARQGPSPAALGRLSSRGSAAPRRGPGLCYLGVVPWPEWPRPPPRPCGRGSAQPASARLRERCTALSGAPYPRRAFGT